MHQLRNSIVIVLIFVMVTTAGCSRFTDFIKEDPLGEMLREPGSAFNATATSSPVESSPSTEVDHGPFILMLDDFSDPNSGWPRSSDDYGRTDYENGGYVVEAYKSTYYFWSVPGENYDDIRIEVDVDELESNGSKDNAYGVDCRIQENGDGYGFRISSDGYVSIILFADTQYFALMDWVASDAVYTDGRANHLTAICQGNHFSLLVNDENVAEVVDDTFTAGDIALSAVSFDEEPVRVVFDDIVVQQLGNPYLYGDQEE